MNFPNRHHRLLCALLLAACGSPTPPPPDEETPVVTNTAPTANAASAQLTQDSAYSGKLTATDAEGDNLTFWLVTPPSHGTVVIAADGNYQYLPAQGYVGEDSFAYQVSDGKSMSAIMVVTIQVAALPSEEEPTPTPVVTNHPPLASTLAINLLEDGIYNGQLVALDADGDTLSYNIQTTVAHGTLALNGQTGAFSYTPLSDYAGSDSFSFTVSDGKLSSSETTVNITITAVNDIPQVSNQLLSLPQDSSLNGQLHASDADSDTLSYQLFSQASHGQLSLNSSTGNFTYTPAPGYRGSDSVQFFVHDGQVPSMLATLSITVTAVNYAPVVNNQALELTEDDSVNGQLVGSDANGDGLTYTLVVAASFGNVVLQTSGQFSYTPASDFNGEDSFLVQASDGQTISNIAEVVLTVTPVNDAPVADDLLGLSTSEWTPVSDVVTGSDIEWDNLSYELAGQAEGGIVSLNSQTGDFTFTPHPGFVGVASFQFVVRDGNLDSAPALVEITVNPQASNLPPDPSTIAPEKDSTVAGNFFNNYSFLTAMQPAMDPDIIEPQRFAIIRGRIIDLAGQPLSGVKIAIKDRPEFSYTYSREDGQYDFVLNGGGQVQLEFSRFGYATAQRKAEVPWRQFVQIDDVAMVALDPNVTVVDLANLQTTAVAKGSIIQDERGTRQAVLTIKPGTQAYLEFAGQASQPIDQLNVRMTEYTAGPKGEEAMPAEIAMNTAYTYATEFSVDEAITAGASGVAFSKPLHVYVDNFLDWPVGTIVPTGTYMRDGGYWQADDNGIVLEIVGVNQNGEAVIDLDGNGAESDQVLLDYGFDSAERKKLIELYPLGTKLWWTRLSHFTPCDLNQIRVACDPQSEDCNPAIEFEGGPSQECNGPECTPLCENASTLACAQQGFSEKLNITGTPYQLHYWNNQQKDYTASRTLTMKIGSETPGNMVDVKVQIAVAGQKHAFFEEPERHSFSFTWDGNDVYGRPTNGSELAKIAITHRFPARMGGSRGGASGGGGGGNGGASINCGSCGTSGLLFGKIYGFDNTFDFDFNVGTFGITKTYQYTLENIISHAKGFSGWAFSDQHFYDIDNYTLIKGDGVKKSTKNLVPVFHTFYKVANLLGAFGPPFFREDGRFYTTFTGNGNTHTRLFDLNASSTVVSNGTGIVSSTINGTVLQGNKIYRMGVDRIYVYDIETAQTTTIAGGGNNYGEDIPATQAAIPQPGDIARDREGNIYFTEFYNGRVRKIDRQGMLYTIFGGGNTNFYEGIPAKALKTTNQFTRSVIIDPVTNYMYVLQRNYIYEMRENGRVYLFAGGGNSLAEGALALNTNLNNASGLVLGPDHNFYYTSDTSKTIRMITVNGKVYTVFGDGAPYEIFQDKPPALSISLQSPAYFSFDSEGRPWVSTKINNVQYFGYISSSFPGFYDTSEYKVPDAGEVYIFDASGRHLRTYDMETNTLIRTFHYQQYGADQLLTGIEDADGNLTQIIRDSEGKPLKIISPFGQETLLSVNSDGYLSSVIEPDGLGYSFTYTAGGLMTSMTNRNNDSTLVQYDADGRLIMDQDQAGAQITLAKQPTQDLKTSEVLMTSAEGRQTLHTTTYDQSANRFEQTVSYANATTKTVIALNEAGTRTTTLPDGTLQTETELGQGRFGAASGNKEYRTKLPSNLERVITQTHSSTLSDPEDAMSLLTETITTNINNRNYVSVYNTQTFTRTTTSPAGRQVVEELDPTGKVVSRSVGSLAAVNYFYNPAGQLTTITQDDGNEVRETSFTYNDVYSRLDSVNDAENQTSLFEYAANNLMTRQVLPSSEEILMSYNNNKDMTEIAPPGQPSHQFNYTPVHLVSAYNPPDLNNTTLYSYNDDRQLESILLPSGAVLDYQYDVATGQLLTINGPGNDDYSYTYSQSTGQLTQIAFNGQNLNFTYDGFLPKSQSWSGAVSGTVSATYNNNFWVTQLNIAGTPVNFAYDNDGLPVTAGAQTLTYNNNGLLASTSLANVSENYAYSAFGELASQSATTGQTLYNAAFIRDKLGRITQKTEDVLGNQVKWNFSYTPDGQLEDVYIDDVLTRSYAYDSNGNRVGGVYNNQDQLLSMNGVTYSYDAAGNLETKTDGNAVTTYDYDAWGNLRSVVLPDNTAIDYVIDGNGRRIGKKIDGVLTTGWLYGGQLNPVAELDGQGNVISRFIYADKAQAPSYMVKNNITYKIISDHLGSVRLVVNAADGSVAQRIDYDEFGNTVSDTNPGFQPFGFAGGIWDASVELVRFGARDYDPAVGRFVQSDPIRFNGGQANLYVYVNNDPINRIDPSGLWTFSYGITVSGSLFGFGGSVDLGANFGYDPDSGTISSSGSVTLNYGAAAGLGIGAGGYVSVTNACNVSQLNGSSEGFGRAGLGNFGLGYFEGAGYQGGMLNAGISRGYIGAIAGYSQTYSLGGGNW